VLALADVVNLFANELSGLGGRTLSLAPVPPGPLDRLLLRHHRLLAVSSLYQGAMPSKNDAGVGPSSGMMLVCVDGRQVTPESLDD
jgi:hypothetical protein